MPYRPREVKVSRADIIAAAEAAAADQRKQRSFYLTEQLLGRVNGAVYWSRAGFLNRQTAGDDLDVSELPDSASQLVERALWAEVLRLERLFNDGEQFPPAPGRLSTGPGEAGAARLRRPRGRTTPESGA